jgi:hypothetical protein
MNNVVLIIIYNHQYNQNIDKLEVIYGKRFSNIYHLVPFYTGDKSNVISVYENSEHFQGYVAQGLKSFFRKEFEHYFFIADDLLLNPIINQSNYTTHFNLNSNTCFMPDIFPLHEVKNHWVGLIRAYYYNMDITGIEAKNQMPDYNKALQKFTEFGIEIKSLKFDDIWTRPAPTPSKILTIFKNILYIWRQQKSKIKKKEYHLTYPMVGGYSDIFIISADIIELFAHYCGVTAATRLFVEVGIPTCMVLLTKDIVTERQLALKGKTLWTESDHQILKKYNSELSSLLNDFPDNTLYIHPIKLSKWLP